MRCGGRGTIPSGDPMLTQAGVTREHCPGCVDCTRYRIVDAFPYLDREEEYGDLSLDEAVARMDDLTGVGADVILSDLDSDGLDVLPWKWVDDETGREVTLRLEVEPTPEAGEMSTTDGLGGMPPDYKQLIRRLQEIRELMDAEAFTIAQVDAIDDSVEALTKAADAAKHAEKAHEEVCAERDEAKRELAEIHARLDTVGAIIRASEGRSLNHVIEDCLAALQHAQEQVGESDGD